MDLKETPAFGFKDIIENNLEPVKESLIGLASSYSLDSVANLTEDRVNGIRIERDKLPFVEPPSEEGRDRANEILNVGAAFWVFLWIQSLKELLKSFLNSIKEGLNSRTILMTKWLQLAFSEMHGRDRDLSFSTSRLCSCFLAPSA